MWTKTAEQPPPTPGLAQWAWNSLFNRQTPMSKYNAMKNNAPNQPAFSSLGEETQDMTSREDTFHYKKNQHSKARYAARDDTDLRKNVSWGTHDYKLRSRSSGFIDEVPERVGSRSSSSRRRRSHDRDFYREKDLIPDNDDEFSLASHNSRGGSILRRSRSASQLDRGSHASLSKTFPGHFPSPYIHKDDILSSGTKNLMAADENTERNRHIPLDSSPPIAVADWRKRLGLPSRAKEGVTQRSKVPGKETSKSHFEDITPSLVPNAEIRSKTLNDYSSTLDQNEILKQLDCNAMELEHITNSIIGLKNEKQNDAQRPGSSLYERDLEKKYKQLREELIQELKKSKKLYDSYFRFVGKYKDLKQKYENSKVEQDHSQNFRGLEKEVLSLRDENQYLRDQVNEKNVKLQEDDFTLTDLKTTLQDSSKFEVTLRRKIKYLEEKLKGERAEHKRSEFDLKEKIYLLEMKAKEDEERLQAAEERIKDLEGTRMISEGAYTYNRSIGGRPQRPMTMGSLSSPGGLSPFKRSSKYAASFQDENENLHEDTIDRLIKETL